MWSHESPSSRQFQASGNDFPSADFLIHGLDLSTIVVLICSQWICVYLMDFYVAYLQRSWVAMTTSFGISVGWNAEVLA